MNSATRAPRPIPGQDPFERQGLSKYEFDGLVVKKVFWYVHDLRRALFVE